MAKSELQRLREASAAEAAKTQRKIEKVVDTPEANGRSGYEAMHTAPKVTMKSARDALISAFHELGGVDGLVKFGQKYPKDFYAIWAKLIPREVSIDPSEKLEDLLTELGGGHLPSLHNAARQIHKAGQEGAPIALDEEFFRTLN